MNQGKSDIIAKRKVQALFRNKQKYKHNNHIQIMFMNINDVTILRKRGGLIRVNTIKHLQESLISWFTLLSSVVNCEAVQ